MTVAMDVSFLLMSCPYTESQRSGCKHQLKAVSGSDPGTSWRRLATFSVWLPKFPSLFPSQAARRGDRHGETHVRDFYGPSLEMVYIIFYWLELGQVNTPIWHGRLANIDKLYGQKDEENMSFDEKVVVFAKSSIKLAINDYPQRGKARVKIWELLWKLTV